MKKLFKKIFSRKVILVICIAIALFFIFGYFVIAVSAKKQIQLEKEITKTEQKIEKQLKERKIKELKQVKAAMEIRKLEEEEIRKEQNQTISELQNIVSEQKNVISQQEEIIKSQQMVTDKLQTDKIIQGEKEQEVQKANLKREEACREKSELFNQAMKIWSCTPGSDWWDNNQIEGTIEGLIVCLRNRMAEKPWLISPNDSLSSYEWYQNKLDQLIKLNPQYLSAKEKCDK